MSELLSFNPFAYEMHEDPYPTSEPRSSRTQARFPGRSKSPFVFGARRNIWFAQRPVTSSGTV